MCGRTSVFQPQPEIERRFSAHFEEEWSPRYNIAPQQNLPVVENDDVETIEQVQWGLVPHWVDDPEELRNKPINARAETVDEKPFFRDAFEKRRCLIIADGFYEWKGQRGSKQPYRVERTDGELFAFAGLWETWSDNGEELETTTIITTEPNDVVAQIHDRMPVMLEQENESTWLVENDPDELKSLLDPYPSEDTRAYPISKAVNDPSNDRPEIIEEIDIGEQSGLSEFEA